jgi:hypothetical protein
MELNDKHIDNLRAMAETPGIRRDQLPHSKLVRFLVKHDLAEVIGRDWIAQVEITDKGRQALEDHE